MGLTRLRGANNAPHSDAQKGLIEKPDGFLYLNDREILTNAGKITHNLANESVEREYGKFHQNEIHKAPGALDTMEALEKMLPEKRPRKHP